MDMSNALAGIGAAVLEARKHAGVHSITASDGMEYCAKCGEPLMLELRFSGAIAEKLGDTRYVPRNCECMRKMFAEEEAAQERERRATEIRNQKLHNLKSEKYRLSTFDKDDGRDPAIRKTCVRYVQNRGKMIDGNLGIAFIGGNGGGKTFWASCIANALIDAGSSVLMTTLTKLIGDMNANYKEDRESILRAVRMVDFLILDDYGAERGTEFSLEQAFEIIDTRYNAGKPLIITANLTEDTLRNPPNMNYGRSYSRIIEMCPAIVRIESRRREEIANNKRKEMAKLLLD